MVQQVGNTMLIIFNPDIPVRSDVIATGERTTGSTFFEEPVRSQADIDEENLIRARRVEYYAARAEKGLPLFDELPASIMD